MSGSQQRGQPHCSLCWERKPAAMSHASLCSCSFIWAFHLFIWPVALNLHSFGRWAESWEAQPIGTQLQSWQKFDFQDGLNFIERSLPAFWPFLTSCVLWCGCWLGQEENDSKNYSSLPLPRILVTATCGQLWCESRWSFFRHIIRSVVA